MAAKRRGGGVDLPVQFKIIDLEGRIVKNRRSGWVSSGQAGFRKGHEFNGSTVPWSEGPHAPGSRIVIKRAWNNPKATHA